MTRDRWAALAQRFALGAPRAAPAYVTRGAMGEIWRLDTARGRWAVDWENAGPLPPGRELGYVLLAWCAGPGKAAEGPRFDAASAAALAGGWPACWTVAWTTCAAASGWPARRRAADGWPAPLRGESVLSTDARPGGTGQAEITASRRPAKEVGGMCGITGWVDYAQDVSARRDVIEAMTATMACRGPDAGRTWCSPRAAVGHRRLAVLDIEGGGQPMRAARVPDVVLSFSGEIYNHRELRTELTGYGHAFRARSDTEVLLRAWLQWGPRCLPRLNGIFAFAVWDAAREELVLARDRMGVKPLFYAPRPAGVLFGSEPKAVLAHPDFQPELDAAGIAELFSQLGTRTPGHGVYRGLAEVKPGCSVRVSRAGIAGSRYWQLEAAPHTDDLASTAGTVRELLTDTVDRQLVADVPVAALLSGGLDSSTLSALAARALGRQDRGKLATYSVDFPGSLAAFRPGRLRPSHDEAYARRAAEHIGSRHTTILLADGDLTAAQHVPLRAHDLPAFGEIYTSMYLLFRELRRHCTVALSGESADEVFGGYPWYHDDAALAAHGYPWAAGGSWAGLLRPDVARQVRLDEHTADGYATAVAEVPWLAGEDARERRIREVRYLGLTRWLPFLLDRKDRLSMATGLEVRVPFCDHRLVEYVWNVPWPVKQAGGLDKGLLRAAAGDLLPDSLLRRRKSSYPSVTGPACERGVYTQLARLLGEPHAPLFSLVDRGRLAAAFHADPALPGRMAMQPATAAPAAFLLDVNEWLASYRVRLV